MSDEVESMFSVTEVPWHGLGKILEHNPSVDEAIVQAGLDWDVNLHRLYAKVEGVELTDIPAFATIRSTDRKPLGVVGPTYRVLQNRDAFKWFQPFIDAGEAGLETAGSLRGGKRVWVLAKLNRDPMVITGNDTVDKFVLLSNSHDGTLAIRCGFTPVRVVCANTLAMAHGCESSKILRVRHTQKANLALEQIREIMNKADQAFEATADQYRALVRAGVVEKQLKQYITLVFKPVIIEGGPMDTEDAKNEAKRLHDRIIPLFEKGRGNDLPGVSGTMWAAYNSITEYLSHERGRSDDIRLDSTWFGQAASLNQRALQVAVKMVATA
jgi:phage/plasmid-like protein (TIGR03299 family)